MAGGFLIADNTCRYLDTSYADGGYTGNGQYGVDAVMRTYAAADARSPFYSERTDYSDAYAAGGVNLYLDGSWPQPSSVDVTYSWYTRGYLQADSELSLIPGVGGFSHGTAHHHTRLVLKQGFVGQESEVESHTVSAPNGGTSHVNVDEGSGSTPTMSVGTPGNEYYPAYVRNVVTTSSSSVIGASGHALADFFGAGTTGLNYVDYHFNLPSGYYISGCG